MIELNQPGQLSYHGKQALFDAIEISLYPFEGAKLLKFSFRFIQPAPSQEEIAYAGLPGTPEEREYLLALPGTIDICPDEKNLIAFLSDTGETATLELAVTDMLAIQGDLQQLLEAPPPGPSVV